MTDTSITALMSDPALTRIMVVGRPDTGKTSLVEELLRAAPAPAALADLELGQSHVGPPAMLGWGFWRNEYQSLEEIPAERLFFVGTTSPLRSPKAAIAGAEMIVGDASEHAAKVIIDTSGAVEGHFARAVKLDKIKVTRTDVVVGLERKGELEQLLREIRHAKLARIVMFPVAARAGAKTPAERRRYRRRRFARYFGGACLRRLPLAGLEIVRFVEKDSVEDHGHPIEGLLVGLVGRAGRHLGMGILEGRDDEARELVVLTPVTDPIHGLIPGRMRLTPAGREERFEAEE